MIDSNCDPDLLEGPPCPSTSLPKTSAADRHDPLVIKQWQQIQDDLRYKIITEDTEAWQSDLTKLKLIGGLDISYPKDAHSQDACTAFTAFVICSFPELKVVYQDVEEVQLDTPYIPGFLAFRESPALIKIVDKVRTLPPEWSPDVLFVDGNGLLHPQQCGLACHIGFHTGIPTIGVAKNLFHLDGIKTEKSELQQLSKAGDYIFVRNKSSEVLGMALKTGNDAINPVYVSVGHKISLESARKVVLAVCKFRVPEPIRFADCLSREFVRKLESEVTSSTKKGKS